MSYEWPRWAAARSIAISCSQNAVMDEPSYILQCIYAIPASLLVEFARDIPDFRVYLPNQHSTKAIEMIYTLW
jgi:hypothetical protein